jgi:colicin import membrane protein
MAARNAYIVSGMLHLVAIGLIFLLAANPPAGLQPLVRYQPVRLVALPGEPKPVQPKPREKAVEKPKPRVESKPEKVTTAKSTTQDRTAGETKEEKTQAATDAGEGGQGGVRLDGAHFPYPYYLSNIQIKILSNFKPVISARDAEGLKAVVFFVINRSGRISDVKLESKSGHFIFDQEAQRAVLRSSPLPALPPAFGSDLLGVHFEFVASD